MKDDWEVIAEGVKPEAAIEFWRGKSAMSWQEMLELAEGERWRAFWVTRMAELDQLQCVYDAIGKALENGETLADFKKNIASVIQKQGWQGYRVENIFRTNMQQAYSAGRYYKMQTVKKSRPYWQYLAIMDRRTRPNHAALHGKVYPADHDFWNTNYPPNGFRCRCGVATLSQRQVDAQGLTVEKVMRNGADPGFANNHGKDWMATLLDAGRAKLEKADPRVAAAAIRGLVKGGFDYWKEKQIGNFPLCILTTADAAQIGAKARVAIMSPETVFKQNDHHPELTSADYALAQDAVEKGEKSQDSPRNLIYILNKPGGVVVIVKATRTGDELYVTSLRRMSRDHAKRDEEIERLKKRKKKADGGASR